MHLVVLLGAGASHDCATNPGDWRPPLTTSLFDPQFAGILHHYPRAEAAAADIRRHVTSNGAGAIGLERCLKERLQDSAAPHRRKQFREVPLYLQELLWTISRQYADRHPDRYDALINAAHHLDEVTFITLNYDTILDERLSVAWGRPLGETEDYITPGRNWALIKPHGSVNWARPVLLDIPDQGDVDDFHYSQRFFDLPEDRFQGALSEQVIVKPRAVHLETLRRGMLDGNREVLTYPALSMPIGRTNLFNCPDRHLYCIRERLLKGDGLHLLVIGYSGLDDAVLKLLHDGLVDQDRRKPFRSLMTVNQGTDATLETAQRIVSAFGTSPDHQDHFAGGFGAWADSGSLEEYFERTLLERWRTNVGVGASMVA